MPVDVNKAAILSGNAACSICHRLMLNGVLPVEPPFFCPDHPEATPLAIENCEHCHGKGWTVSKERTTELLESVIETVEKIKDKPTEDYLTRVRNALQESRGSA